MQQKIELPLPNSFKNKSIAMKPSVPETLPDKVTNDNYSQDMLNTLVP